MAVLETRVKLDGLTSDDLIEVYRIFCDAYGITSTNRDEETLRLRGIEPLKNTDGVIDYRPYDGAQFLCTRKGDDVHFVGTCRRCDWRGKEKNLDLQERIRDYFKNKTSLGSI